MSATAVSISSNGLLLLGAKPFSDFSEPQDHVTLCANLYPSVRDTVLRAHSWNCATKRVLLSPLASTPAFDFQYEFQLPADWLRTIQVGLKGNTIPYRSEGRRILANVAALPLVYVFRNDIPGTWSTNLVHVMELAMAASLAYPVTSSTTMMQAKQQEYTAALKVAKAIDGQDDPPEEFEEGSFAEARFT